MRSIHDTVRAWRLLVLGLMIMLAACARGARRSTLPRDERFETFVGLSERAHSEPDAEVSRPVPPRQPRAEPVARGSGFARGAARPNRYAIVIGIERYRDARIAPGAARDAQRFAAVVRTTMGVPDDHLKLLLDERATRTDIEDAFAWVGMRTNARSEVVVFFAGHGSATAGADNKLVPLLFTYEGSPSNPDTAIPLQAMLNDFGAQARPGVVLAFVDACSETIQHSTRGGVVFAPRAVSTAVYSAASIGELSSPVEDGSSGLFTSRLLDGIGAGAADVNGDSEITLGELDAYVTNRVRRYASEKLGKRQTPALAISGRTPSEKLVIAEGLVTSER